jgi:hypothetical protein
MKRLLTTTSQAHRHHSRETAACHIPRRRAGLLCSAVLSPAWWQAFFHHDGWAPGAIDLDDETIAFLIAYHMPCPGSWL